MTIEEFDKTGFTGQMKCIFQGKEYGIATVNFEERLIGIYEMISGAESEDDISWKRCENIELLPNIISNCSLFVSYDTGGRCDNCGKQQSEH